MSLGIHKGIKKNILIIGGGFGALRYVESLIWDNSFFLTMSGMEVLGKTRALAEKYSLPYIPFKQLKTSIIRTFDCIIVAVSLEGKRSVVESLKKMGYEGAWIIEKPLAVNYEDLVIYKKILVDLPKCAVVCQRDFLGREYSIPEADEYRVFFPSYKSDARFNIIHMLPHVLSWLISNIDHEQYSEQTSLKALHAINETCIEGLWRGSRVVIHIADRSLVKHVIVNGMEYPNIQYRKVNAEIVKQVLDFRKEQSKINIERAIRVSSFIIGILEDLML